MAEQSDENILSYSPASIENPAPLRFAVLSIVCSIITVTGTTTGALLPTVARASYFEANLLLRCMIPLCVAGAVFGLLGIFQSRNRGLAVVGIVISSLNAFLIPSLFIA
jgi:hypothetical protein